MKLIITTLTGDKHELEVAPHDTVKDVKRLIYESKKASSQVRLLQGQTVLEDDLKLSEYSLPEGAVISALFEPDVDINIEVRTGSQVHSLTVSNTMTVMALKVQICDVMSYGVAPEKLEIRLGDITLDDPMPFHFYGVRNGSLLSVLKPYVSVTIDNNQGNSFYWRLNRKDTIREVKAKLAQSTSQMKFDVDYKYEFISEIRGVNGSAMSVEGMRLYLISEATDFKELDDDEIIENYKIKDADNLYVLSYRWGFNTCTVIMTKNGKKIQGVEDEDTCLAIKLRVQDQFCFPVCNIKLFEHGSNTTNIKDYSYIIRRNIRNSGIPDEERPFSKRRNESLYSKHPRGSNLVAITIQELQIEGDRVEEERKAREAERARRAEEARLEKERKIQAEKEEQARIEEERKAREAMWAEKQRASLEAAAAKEGLTVEEYERARRAEEARLERQRKIQAQKVERLEYGDILVFADETLDLLV